MATAAYHYIGSGVYSLSEAERLTRIPRRRIRRWVEGYAYTSRGVGYQSPPLIGADFGRDVGGLSLSFADLLEIRFLDAFHRHGVKWPSIRIAAACAREVLEHSHPFSSKRFKTDGRDILVEIATRGKSADLLNLTRNQYEFRKVVSPMLYAGFDYNEHSEPERWWPMGRRKGVVLDPERSFGAPIAAKVGVPTEILAASARAEGSMRATAAIYEVPLSAVRASIEFETRYPA